MHKTDRIFTAAVTLGVMIGTCAGAIVGLQLVGPALLGPIDDDIEPAAMRPLLRSTATPEPTPTAMPTATPTPAPTATSTPSPTPTPTSGPGYDSTQQAIFDHFEPHGVGNLFVRVAYFEGYNEVSDWSIDYVRANADACPLQINQVHDDTPTSAIRVLFGDDARWPGPVLDLDGCLAIGEYLYLADLEAGRDGLTPWRNSRVRPNGRGGSTGWGTSDPIYNSAGDLVAS